MLTALGELSSTQTQSMATKSVVKKFMTLHIDSDASYLLVRKARSRSSNFLNLSTASQDPTKPPTTTLPKNGPLHTLCSILKNGMVSTAEAELGGLLSNAQEAIIIWMTLEKLGHLQLLTPIKIDNLMAVGVVNKSLK